ncbi:hypothetical protein BH24ACI3_BH24ACI3_16730 [soil metagenome]
MPYFTVAPPKDYFAIINGQINSKMPLVSGISSPIELKENLEANAVPSKIIDMEIGDYPEFLILRRKLIAQKIRDYYFAL